MSDIFSFTIDNDSDHDIGLKNGMTGYDEHVSAHHNKTFSLAAGNPYQAYYNASTPWGDMVDYLFAITKDGYSNSTSVTFQQPAYASETSWYAKDLNIGGKNFGTTEMTHWSSPNNPPYNAVCDNRSWGSICTASANYISLKITN